MIRRRQRPERAPSGASPAVPQDRGATELLGDLEGPVATVDRAGTVALTGARWRVGWAVGAEDRWHVAAEEAAVRSCLVDDMPVTATAMKVPGGDVVLQAAAGRAAAGRVVVLEFTNDTPVPVSLAVGVTGSITSAAVNGSRLLVDGRVAVDLGRAPGGAAAVDDGDVWRAVRAEPSPGDCEARSRAGLAAAAAVIPLAPRMPLRVAVPVEDGSAAGAGLPGDTAAGRGSAASAGSPREIAAGWRAVVERAASVELPDDTAVRAWRRGIAALILAAGCAEPAALAQAAVALDRVGLPYEADRAREALVGEAGHARMPPPVAAAALRALASRRLRTGRTSGLAELAGPLAAAAGDCLDPLTLEQVAAVLETEAPAGARDARRLLARTASPASPPPAPATVDGLDAVARNSVAFGGDGLAAVEVLLDCLVSDAADHLMMLPAPSAAWRGASVDTDSLVTRHGVLSFSVRWHGPRPAVLWEVQPAGVGDPAKLIRCGLDDSWASTALNGEALLRAELLGP